MSVPSSQDVPVDTVQADKNPTIGLSGVQHCLNIDSEQCKILYCHILSCLKSKMQQPWEIRYNVLSDLTVSPIVQSETINLHPSVMRSALEELRAIVGAMLPSHTVRIGELAVLRHDKIETATDFHYDYPFLDCPTTEPCIPWQKRNLVYNLSPGTLLTNFVPDVPHAVDCMLRSNVSAWDASTRCDPEKHNATYFSPASCHRAPPGARRTVLITTLHWNVEDEHRDTFLQSERIAFGGVPDRVLYRDRPLPMHGTILLFKTDASAFALHCDDRQTTRILDAATLTETDTLRNCRAWHRLLRNYAPWQPNVTDHQFLKHGRDGQLVVTRLTDNLEICGLGYNYTNNQVRHVMVDDASPSQTIMSLHHPVLRSDQGIYARTAELTSDLCYGFGFFESQVQWFDDIKFFHDDEHDVVALPVLQESFRKVIEIPSNLGDNAISFAKQLAAILALYREICSCSRYGNVASYTATFDGYDDDVGISLTCDNHSVITMRYTHNQNKEYVFIPVHIHGLCKPHDEAFSSHYSRNVPCIFWDELLQDYKKHEHEKGATHAAISRTEPDLSCEF